MYKTNYPAVVSPIFSKQGWWRIVLITIAACLVGPLILYKNQRSIPFSVNYYLRLTEYFLIIAIPFVALLIWSNWREATKQNRGYGWIGKFEVVGKRSTLAFRHLMLSPGTGNQVKVERDLYEKIRVGEFVLIRRDAFGKIEKVSKIKNLSSRLARVAAKHIQKNQV